MRRIDFGLIIAVVLVVGAVLFALQESYRPATPVTPTAEQAAEAFGGPDEPELSPAVPSESPTVGSPRSGKWRAYRDEFISMNPRCEACGSTNGRTWSSILEI